MAGLVAHHNKGEQLRGSILLPGAMALCGLALVGFLQISHRENDRDVTVVFPPHISFGEAAARVNSAGAAVLSAGAAGNIVVARMKDPSDTQSLREVGAWFIVLANAPELCSAAPWDEASQTNITTVL